MKRCPKCGHLNPDSYAFCIKDGSPLPTEPLQHPEQMVERGAGEREVFHLLNEHLCPAENEQEIKAYHCTSFESWILQLRAEGHLVVTNKRVVFHASGWSFAGKSILQSEVPIEDVSGISIYKGSYFSLQHFFGSLFLSVFVSGIIYMVLTGLVVAIGRQTLQNASTTDIQELESTANSIVIAGKVVLWLLASASFLGSFLFSKQNILRSTLAGIAPSALAGLGTASLLTSVVGNYLNQNNGSGGSEFILFLAVLAGIYALICYFWFARRPTMSLAVGSKGGSSTPIAISGISSFGLYDTAASKALSAEPAEDAETLLRELGAMVLDIQAAGDLAVQQWQQK